MDSIRRPAISKIENDEQHADALVEIDKLWGARIGTADGNRLEILVKSIVEYERERWPMEAPTPEEIVEFRAEQLAMRRV